jgi:type I restriction enzyme, S subunit
MMAETLPSEWSSISLSSTALPGKNGFDDGDWIESPYITTAGIRLIQTGNIGVGKFVDKPDTHRFISTASFRSLGCKWVHPGDLLICRLAEPIGRACAVPEHVGDSVTAVDCTIYRANPTVACAGYILHRLNTQEHLKACVDVAGGSTRQRISRGNLGALQVPLPPLPEQRRIAKILDTIDEVIRKTEQVIAKLQQMKQGLLYDLLTRGIDDNGELRDPVKNPEQFKESELGLIPKGWEVPALQELTDCIIDGTHHTPSYVNEGVPFLRVTDLHSRQIDPESVEHIPAAEHRALIKRCHPRQGDVLLSKNGTVGIARKVDWSWTFSIFVSLALIRAKQDRLSGAFLEMVLGSFVVGQQIHRRSKQGTVTNLHLEEIREFQIPVPSAQEQQMLVALLKDWSAVEFSEVHRLTKLKALKAGLGDDLLSGRVRVDA